MGKSAVFGLDAESVVAPRMGSSSAMPPGSAGADDRPEAFLSERVPVEAVGALPWSSRFLWFVDAVLAVRVASSGFRFPFSSVSRVLVAAMEPAAERLGLSGIGELVELLRPAALMAALRDARMDGAARGRVIGRVRSLPGGSGFREESGMFPEEVLTAHGWLSMELMALYPAAEKFVRSVPELTECGLVGEAVDAAAECVVGGTVPSPSPPPSVAVGRVAEMAGLMLASSGSASGGGRRCSSAL